jgi:hypothetical protein
MTEEETSISLAEMNKPKYNAQVFRWQPIVKEKGRGP